jgi:hypothetical protein
MSLPTTTPTMSATTPLITAIMMGSIDFLVFRKIHNIYSCTFHMA